MPRLANILDPIHDGLDPTVFDNPESERPKLEERHRKWITRTIINTLDDLGYDGMESWLRLVFTGSLTTYQYSPESDVDVSLFVNAEKFPEWSRAEMIGQMVAHVDGTVLPGTTHPMQAFVLPRDVQLDDLYRPGLRSGYDLDLDEWIVPPEKGRVHDVQREMNVSYVHAMEQADKMQRLLEFEPDKAIMLWHQIHKRRRRDHQAGKGDYSDSNITYKMLANKGLFPLISEYSGEYIAKAAATQCVMCGATVNPQDTTCPQCLNPLGPHGTTDWHAYPQIMGQPVASNSAYDAPMGRRFVIDNLAVKRLADELGLQKPVVIEQVNGTHGSYADKGDHHYVGVVGWLGPDAAQKQIRHELQHALQLEQQGSLPERPIPHEEYRNMPTEQDARSFADENGEPLVHVISSGGSYRDPAAPQAEPDSPAGQHAPSEDEQRGEASEGAWSLRGDGIPTPNLEEVEGPMWDLRSRAQS